MRVIWAFNRRVAESWMFGNRVIVEDARGDGSFIRITWHPDGQQFVFSHWRGDICLAATRIPVAAAPHLIGLLAKGLGEVPIAAPAPAASPPRGRWARVRGWLRREPSPERPHSAEATVSAVPHRWRDTA